jgi:hypothetical protein
MSEYDTDIVSWSEHQADLLRRHATMQSADDPAPDWPNIIKEIESVGRLERSAPASHIRTVLEHFVKLDTSPTVEPRGGWRQTELRARAAIDHVLEESPSLRPTLETYPAVGGPYADRIRENAARAIGTGRLHRRPGARSVAPRRPELSFYRANTPRTQAHASSIAAPARSTTPGQPKNPWFIPSQRFASVGTPA